jgi:hypothetical protein
MAVATTLSAVLFALAGSAATPAAPLLLAVPFLLFGAWSLRRTADAFRRPDVRARVTAAVSGL